MPEGHSQRIFALCDFGAWLFATLYAFAYVEWEVKKHVNRLEDEIYSNPFMHFNGLWE